MRTTMKVLLVGMGCVASVAHGAGFDNLYTSHTGDLNSDGQTDIYLKKTTQIVFVDVGDLLTPIVTSQREVGEFYLQNLGNGQFAMAALSPSQLSTVLLWPESDISVVARHINFDSAADAQLVGIDEVIAGALDQMIFAAEDDNELPVSIRAMDEGLQKFTSDSFAWALDVNYFRNNAPWKIVGVDPGTGTWQGAILDPSNLAFINYALQRCEAEIFGDLCIVSSVDPSPCVRSVVLRNEDGVAIGTGTRDVCVASLHVWGYSPGAIVRERDYSHFHSTAVAIANEIEQRSPGGIQDIPESGMDAQEWEILNDIIRELLKGIYGEESVEEEEEEEVPGYFSLLCSQIEDNHIPHDPFPLDEIFPESDSTFHHYDQQTKACEGTEPGCSMSVFMGQVLPKFSYPSKRLVPTNPTFNPSNWVLVYVSPPGLTRWPRFYTIPFGYVVQRVLGPADIGPENGQWQIGAIQNITTWAHAVYPGTISRTMTLGIGTKPHFFTHGIGLNRAGTTLEEIFGPDVPSQGINMLMGCSNDVWGPEAFRTLDKQAVKWWQDNISAPPASAPVAVGFGIQ